MRRRLVCRVQGRVQMVMFRDFVTRNARARGVIGTVQNRPDGTVVITAEAEEEVLVNLLEVVRRGPLLARVDNIEEEWSEPLGGYKNFDILY